MKIATIIGARPQFIKAAAVSRAIADYNRLTPHSSPLTEVIIHTGQHYDYGMSEVFFRELEIPEPAYNLEVGSGSQGAQTGLMLARIEEVLLKEQPDRVLVYGDTNSTLAGALAAAKLHIPVGHVEAGLRSFNRRMPEEINRVVTDHLANLLFCPSRTAVDNLIKEGFTNILDQNEFIIPNPGVPNPLPPNPVVSNPVVINVGDVMGDALKFALSTHLENNDLLSRLGIKEKAYLLATVHRPENTDDPDRLGNIMVALSELAEREAVVLPLHPRTRKILDDNFSLRLTLHPSLKIIAPVGYFDVIALEKSARLLLTDSGGMQKEAYWLKVPCITLRDETEWVETLEAGWNILVGADPEKIKEAAQTFQPPADHPPLFGDGNAAAKIVNILLSGG